MSQMKQLNEKKTLKKSKHFSDLSDKHQKDWKWTLTALCAVFPIEILTKSTFKLGGESAKRAQKLWWDIIDIIWDYMGYYKDVWQVYFG